MIPWAAFEGRYAALFLNPREGKPAKSARMAIGALAIFTFINVWNDYTMQLMMLILRANLSISLGIATLQAE